MPFYFEIIKKIMIEDNDNFYFGHTFIIFRETSTDTLYVSYNDRMTEMINPETGLPLTYKVWKVKYNK